MTSVEKLKPKMKRRGMFHMKHIRVALGVKYENLMESAHRHSLIGYLYEVCNLCNGKRTLVDIRRILGHELGPMDIEILVEMVNDMEQLGYLTISE